MVSPPDTTGTLGQPGGTAVSVLCTVCGDGAKLAEFADSSDRPTSRCRGVCLNMPNNLMCNLGSSALPCCHSVQDCLKPAQPA